MEIKTEKYQNISGKTINIDGKSIKKEEIIEIEKNIYWIKPLLSNKYIKKIEKLKGDK